MLSASFKRQARRGIPKSFSTALKRKFGISRLRNGQKDVIDSVLAGQDKLAVMPTGGGKSLCYQIPATMLPGMTIVVSPLISLMKDQLEKLTAFGIEAVLGPSSGPIALNDESTYSYTYKVCDKGRQQSQSCDQQSLQ
jgi:ATP-dependent DNA helicase RecQ